MLHFWARLVAGGVEVDILGYKGRKLKKTYCGGSGRDRSRAIYCGGPIGTHFNVDNK